MSELQAELCTVDFAAERLQLHPKTVLRFIRAGRLRATRVGKSYRIVRADLDSFAGIPAQAPAPSAQAWVTTIVDVPGVGPELAQRWARQLPSALQSKPRDRPPLRADLIYEPERAHLKIIVIGAPAESVALLSLIRVWLEQLRA